MSRMLASAAAFALMAVLTLPSPAGATERRADGLRQNDSAMTEFSSQRRWHRRHYVRRHFWGPRRHFVRRHFWGPRFGYWGPRYAYSPYHYRPWPGPFHAHAGFGPVVSFGVGFGPRFWW
jgi:hypothetical protein